MSEEKKADDVGIPSVTAKKKNTKIGLILFMLAIVLGLITIAFVIYKKLSFNNEQVEQDQQVQQNLTSSRSLAMPALPPKDPEEENEKNIASNDVTKVEQLPKVQVVEYDANGNPLPTLEELKYAAPMMGEIATVNTQTQGQNLYQGPDLSNINTDSPLMGQNSQRDLAQRLESVTTNSSTARTIKNKSMILSKGTIIECILETRVDTTVPGMTTCIVPKNIYSMDGRVLLVEKGTRAIGEYQGSVANGLARIFMLWTELRTPKGVVININSPATDQLGAAGMGGYVDFHWWQRFGNALLFSMISDGFQYIVNTANSNNTNSNVTYENTDNGMSEIIKEAMRQSGNIPPTLIKNQGERVAIFVARDLNFESVYELRAN